MDKKSARLRRARRTRERIKVLGATRLCIHKTPRHIYAQIIVPAQEGTRVVASASSLDKECRGQMGYTGNIAAGFKYHGRVKALADAARENGLEF